MPRIEVEPAFLVSERVLVADKLPYAVQVRFERLPARIALSLGPEGIDHLFFTRAYSQGDERFQQLKRFPLDFAGKPYRLVIHDQPELAEGKYPDRPGPDLYMEGRVFGNKPAGANKIANMIDFNSGLECF
jgi:hypothetical protein